MVLIMSILKCKKDLIELIDAEYHPRQQNKVSCNLIDNCSSWREMIPPCCINPFYYRFQCYPINDFTCCCYRHSYCAAHHPSKNCYSQTEKDEEVFWIL